MEYRKIAADRLFTGLQLLGSDAVLIVDEIGRVRDITTIEEAGENIERFSGMVCPGFVNCHCHLELSHMHGVVPPGGGMVDFLLGVMTRRNSDAELVQRAIEKAERQMWANGIVAVGDICNTADTLSVKTHGRLYYHNFIETTGFISAAATARYTAATALRRMFAAISPTTIVPHAPYSVSPVLLELINSSAENELISVHNQESVAENEFIASGTGDFLRLYSALNIDIKDFRGFGSSGLIHILTHLSNAEKLLLVHNTFTSAADLEHAASTKSNLYWCLCPKANLYINGCLPDVPMLRQRNGTIVIGTDSLASNDELNIVAEINTLIKAFPDIPYEEILRWATLNGAQALGIDNRYGSFEKGKTPGVVQVDGGVITRIC